VITDQAAIRPRSFGSDMCVGACVLLPFHFVSMPTSQVPTTPTKDRKIARECYVTGRRLLVVSVTSAATPHGTVVVCHRIIALQLQSESVIIASVATTPVGPVLVHHTYYPRAPRPPDRADSRRQDQLDRFELGWNTQKGKGNGTPTRRCTWIHGWDQRSACLSAMDWERTCPSSR